MARKQRTTPIPPPVPGAIWIPLTRGLFALIDEADAHLAKLTWHAIWMRTGWYAAGRKGGPDGRTHTTRLHREVLGAVAGQMVDHVNGDRLDCRRANLRFTDFTGNAWNIKRHRDNVSGWKGVHPDHGRWRAQITLHRRKIHLGMFDKAEDAARAYDAAARTHFGAFAALNFPSDGTRGARRALASGGDHL